MKIEIDPSSGFCFGVVYAISKAELILKKWGKLYVIGDIVHNDEEVKRLANMGMTVIDHEQLKKLKNQRVLIRAHGEPPETYKIAYQNNIELIDATCPVVLNLQKKVRQSYHKMKQINGQVVIFGKPDHPEVIGLHGQTQYNAIIIQSTDQALEKINFSKPVELFSQTTKNLQQYYNLVNFIQQRMKAPFHYHDSICRLVANRNKHFEQFCKNKDIILFVSGKKSSNGKMLFQVCKNVNPKTYFLSSPDEINFNWFNGNEYVGICGATSTPQWLMQKVKEKLENYFAI